jgi:hypothetical protein
MGKRLYDGRPGRFLGRQGDSQSDVVDIAISDERAVPHFLVREHERLLRFTPARSDVKRWGAALTGDGCGLAGVYAEWFCSPAFERRSAARLPLPNRLFVRTLFVDLLGRLPDEAETQRIRNALDGLTDSAPLRSMVARLLLDSGQVPLPQRASLDPVAWITGLFERLLGRPPAERERAVFVESLADPACRLETVVYAIVSHPEYQSW